MPHDEEASTKMSGSREWRGLMEQVNREAARTVCHQRRSFLTGMGRWCLTKPFGNFERKLERFARAFQPSW